MSGLRYLRHWMIPWWSPARRFPNGNPQCSRKEPSKKNLSSRRHGGRPDHHGSIRRETDGHQRNKKNLIAPSSNPRRLSGWTTKSEPERPPLTDGIGYAFTA